MKQLPSICSLSFEQLQAKVIELGAKPFLANQIVDWLYRKYEFNPDAWTNISKQNLILLKENFSFDLPSVLWNGLSTDGTRKFLIKLSDAQTVEAVAIPAKNRLSLCISSQVGCAMGCTFCHTATQGLKRHLRVEEVVGQYLQVTKWLKTHVDQEARLSNIVYMGQGEPLHNFENMKTATEIFMHPKGIGLGQRKITLSTSGLAPQIEKLVDFPPINLAISLHSPRDEVRSELMPINKAYNLERLFLALSKVPLKANRRITYEYLLIEELTDTQEDAKLLVERLVREESKINLIPFNEFPGSSYKRPSDQRISWFQKYLMDAGFTCTVRVSKGEDILAACGQLKSQYDQLNQWSDEKQKLVEFKKQMGRFSYKTTLQEEVNALIENED
jgi:23S rRNA (adenine2503-C2)-methyltransferase